MINIATSRSVEVIDITSRVAELVKKSRVKDGICLVFSAHTTTGVVINEAERGLLIDILNHLAQLAPSGAGYRHNEIDSNAHAHLQAIMLGNSAVVPVKDSSLALGTWQRILFVELDGPRERRVMVRVMPGEDGGEGQNQS